jgi:uncharacterized membrane protein (UPF0127 family)
VIHRQPALAVAVARARAQARAPGLALVVVLAAALASGGCSRLPVRTVTIGDQPWTVYVGSGDGMRGLDGFGEVDGMLFDMGREVDPGGVPFGMEDVGFPIDIAWFDGVGALVSTAAMAPCDGPPCPRYHAAGPYRWAVEAPAGAFADLAPDDVLVVGD